MTELLDDPAEVRLESGLPTAIRVPGGGWRRVAEVAARWRVETDWWQVAIRRDYVRCLLEDGSCVELRRDLDDGSWHCSRRYD